MCSPKVPVGSIHLINKSHSIRFKNAFRFSSNSSKVRVSAAPLEGTSRRSIDLGLFITTAHPSSK